MSIRTLVLTCGEQPHRIVRWEKGICLLVKGKVEVLHTYGAIIPSERAIIQLPSVVKLRSAVPRVHRTVRFGRMSIYLRDGFRCSYCNDRHPPEDLTYDHVIPRDKWKGDPQKLTDWENIVTACWDCNQKKKNRTPQQAGMKLLRKPHKPTWLPPMPFFMPKDAPKEWRLYLPDDGTNEVENAVA